MHKFKKFSVMFIVGPSLFLGCTSEKTASVKPTLKSTLVQSEPITKEILVEEENQPLSRKEKLLASAIFGGEISLDEENETQKFSPKPMPTKLTQQSLTLNNNWRELTKEEEILETARRFLGVKYIWAANGPSAFDCSGFTKYVFKESGISLPRYSGHQANMGKKVKFSEMQKGDLVFFDTKKKFTKEVNHVGIFLGNNKFIHASSGGKRVMITSFEEKKFYRNKFLYARRVINSNSFALNRNTKPDNFVN